jgi:hypothetical protein
MASKSFNGIRWHRLEVGPRPIPYEAIETFLVTDARLEADRSQESLVITWNPKRYLKSVRCTQMVRRLRGVSNALWRATPCGSPSRPKGSSVPSSSLGTTPTGTCGRCWQKRPPWRDAPEPRPPPQGSRIIRIKLTYWVTTATAGPQTNLGSVGGRARLADSASHFRDR